MHEKYDLHCHSNVSDGVLTPTELVMRAGKQGVTTLALTDHDTTAGYHEAKTAANAANIRLVSGIELSTSWQDKSFHIIGLGVDAKHPALQAATRHLQVVRQERAELMAAKLEKKKIYGALEWVRKSAGDSMITRTHFANFLVAHFHVSSQQEAFDRYLAKGKPAFVATAWADLASAVDWINQAGGIAVLAHPLRYKLSANWMQRLLAAFKEAGGQGIEVVTGRCSADEIIKAAEYADNFALAGSAGSDFHSPDNPWVELGRLAALPKHVKPVWELFG